MVVVSLSSYPYAPRERSLESSSYLVEGGEGALTLDRDLSVSSRLPGDLDLSRRRESRGSRDIVALDYQSPACDLEVW